MDAIEGIELNKAIQKMRNEIFEMQRTMMSEERIKELEIKREADRKATTEQFAKKSRGRPKKVATVVESTVSPTIESLAVTGTELPAEKSFQSSIDDSEVVNPKAITSDDFNADKIIEWEKENRKKEKINSLNKKNKSNWFSKIFNRAK